MNKETTIKIIEKKLNWWKKNTGLSYWNFDYYFYDNDIAGHETAEAVCAPDWRYQYACLEFSLPKLIDKTEKYIEEMVVHELAHVLLNEIHREEKRYSDHEGRTATQLQKAFVLVRDAAIKELVKK